MEGVGWKGNVTNAVDSEMNLKGHLAWQECKKVMTDFPLTTICQTCEDSTS